MSEMTLSRVLDAAEHKDEGISYPVPPNWTQGRTAYGGFTASLLLAAARARFDDLPPLRSAMVNFTAPVSEPPEIRSEVLRQGRNVTTVASKAMIGDKVAATSTFSFGRAQESVLSADLPAGPADAPEDTPNYFPPNFKAPAEFFNNFDAKLIEGNLPFSGSDRGYVRGWVRHKDPAVRGRPEGLIAIADVLPPSAFIKLTQFGPNSSVNWIVNLLTDNLQTRDGWWMIESNLTAGRDGYSSQVMRMWNTEGELVVDGMQSVLIFV